MFESSPFLLRRVFAGVLVGLALIVAGCFGWAQYRMSQYHGRENRLVGTYQSAYRTCVLTLGRGADCATRVTDACTGDPFWSRHQPFSFGLGSGLDEASIKCVFGRSGR